MHDLGVTDLHIVAEHNFLISLSFDCSCAIMEATAGVGHEHHEKAKVFFRIDNPKRSSGVRYTGLLWDDTYDQLLLAGQSVSQSVSRLDSWLVRVVS